MAEKLQIKLNYKTNTCLTEDVYSNFSNDVYFLMQSLYAGRAPNMQVALRGNQGQIMAFMTALQREKRYMDAFMKHGLNNAQTMTSRAQLQNAVEKFEFETGLRWPFTH